MRNFLTIFFIVVFVGCTPEKTNKDNDPNPPMEGFDMESSDAKAMEIADSVMAALGGRKTWDNTHYISWTFSGRRKLLWDKWKGDVRIEFTNDPQTIYLVNVNSGSGKVLKKGEEVTHPDSLAKELKRAEAIWINDSYWLCMPFKLKDTGVTLTYLREDTTLTGEPADVIQLMFENVGNTPENKYEVWVSKANKLVTQWAYFRVNTQDSASFIRPWDNYKKYGDLMMSGDRSDNAGPGDIKVMETVPDGAFSSFDSIELN